MKLWEFWVFSGLKVCSAPPFSILIFRNVNDDGGKVGKIVLFPRMPCAFLLFSLIFIFFSVVVDVTEKSENFSLHKFLRNESSLKSFSLEITTPDIEVIELLKYQQMKINVAHAKMFDEILINRRIQPADIWGCKLLWKIKLLRDRDESMIHSI